MEDTSTEGMSGDYIGFYNYGDGAVPHTMEVNLSFHGGRLSGRGIDDVGFWTCSGSYGGGECCWIKTYASHTVDYAGFLESGRIWGTWNVFFSRGGFSLWPRKSGSEKSKNEGTIEVPEEFPIVRVVPIPKRLFQRTEG